MGPEIKDEWLRLCFFACETLVVGTIAMSSHLPATPYIVVPFIAAMFLLPLFSLTLLMDRQWIGIIGLVTVVSLCVCGHQPNY